jgi:hypothetical protein
VQRFHHPKPPRKKGWMVRVPTFDDICAKNGVMADFMGVVGRKM